MAYTDYIMRDGPQIYYTFDGSTSPPTDETGKSSVSTTTGSPSPGSEAAEQIEGASFEFDGNSYYTLDVKASDLGIDGSNKKTFECWCKPNADNDETAISVGSSEEAGRTFLILHNADGNPGEWLIVTSAGEDLVMELGRSSAGVWEHVVGVWDGQEIIGYINAQEMGRFTPSSVNTFDDPVTIADWRFLEDDRVFDGLLDEAAIYNYALTPQQIRRHYWASQGYTGYKLEHLAVGPIAYWPLTEETGTTSSNLVSSNKLNHERDFTVGGETSVTGDPALRYDSNGGISKTDDDITTSGDATVMAWFKSNPNSSVDFSNEVMRSSGGAACQLNSSSGISFYNGSDVINSDSVITQGEWHHLAWVWKSGTLTGYVDGIKKDSGSDSADYTWTQTAKDQSEAADDQSLSNIAIFDRAVSEQELRRIIEISQADNSYRIEAISSLPMAYWKLDETSGSTATDETANANDASYVGSPTLGDTALITQNKAVTLGAAGDRIEFPALGVFDGSQAFSVEGWVSADDLTGNPSLFNAWAERAVMLQLNNSGISELEATASVGGSAVSIASGSLSTGTAYYVALTYDPTDGWALYLDGDLIGTDGTTGTIDTKSLTSNTIGEASDGTQTFLGTVDEWAVYDRALTQEEIIRHYYVGLLGPVLATILLLDGVVTDESDGSALDATIRAYRWSDGALLQTTTSDPSTGEYRIEEVEDTDLLVVMQPPSGYRPLAHGPLKPDEGVK